MSLYPSSLALLLAPLPLRNQEILLEELLHHPRLTKAVVREHLATVRQRMADERARAVVAPVVTREPQEDRS